jgi:hypothetical protein
LAAYLEPPVCLLIIVGKERAVPYSTTLRTTLIFIPRTLGTRGLWVRIFVMFSKKSHSELKAGRNPRQRPRTECEVPVCRDMVACVFDKHAMEGSLRVENKMEVAPEGVVSNPTVDTPRLLESIWNRRDFARHAVILDGKLRWIAESWMRHATTVIASCAGTRVRARIVRATGWRLAMPWKQRTSSRT